MTRVYVIQRIETGAYVGLSQWVYTAHLSQARVFYSRKEARIESRPEFERVIEVEIR